MTWRKDPIDVFRHIWWTAAWLLALAGGLLAVVLSPVDAVAIIAMAGTCAGTLSFNLRTVGTDAPAAKGTLRKSLRDTAVAATFSVGLYGLGMTAGLMTLLLATFMAAGSPPVLRWLRSRSSAGQVPSYSDLEICTAWQTSYRDLLGASTADRLPIVEERQHLLDELERRHPAEVRDWLMSDARPSSSPRRFLRTED